jgi:hypothetical protein
VAEAPGWWQDETGKWFPPLLEQHTDDAELRAFDEDTYNLLYDATTELLGHALKLLLKKGKRFVNHQWAYPKSSKNITQAKMLTLAQSQSWLMQKYKAGFNGHLLFTCIGNNSRRSQMTLICEMLQTSDGAHMVAKMEMEMNMLGIVRQKTINTYVDVFDYISA